jgi:hypothetical protein
VSSLRDFCVPESTRATRDPYSDTEQHACRRFDPTTMATPLISLQVRPVPVLM